MSRTETDGERLTSEDWTERHARIEGRRTDRVVTLDRSREEWTDRHARIDRDG